MVTARAPRAGKTVLRDLKRRDMRQPVVAIGDGTLGFWAAVRDVRPKTREQRDWFHKLGNILDKLPKRLQPRVKAALHEVMYAETREQAREAITRFATEYGPKYPKGVTTLEKDRRRAAHVLRLPRRALEAPADVECDRVILRDRAAASTGYGGRRLTDEGAPDGLQAPRHGADPVAPARRCTPPATGACLASPSWMAFSQRGRVASRRRRRHDSSKMPAHLWAP